MRLLAALHSTLRVEDHRESMRRGIKSKHRIYNTWAPVSYSNSGHN